MLAKPWKIDLHNHTAEDSVDALDHSAVDLVKLASEKEYAAIAITLHEQQKPLEEAVALGKDLGVLVLPGIEFTLEGKHVLAIGLDTTDANSIHSAEDLRSAKQEYQDEVLIIAPHPFYIISGSLNGKFHQWVELFDAMEVTRLNCPLTGYFNKKSRQTAASLGLPILANSDSHHPNHFGGTYSVCTKEENFFPPTKGDIFSHIREKNFLPVCPPMSTWELGSTIAQAYYKDALRKWNKKADT